MFLKDWYYPGSDPALSVFTLANPRLPSVPDGGNVLEIGSCDTPFANMVKKANPTLSVTGVDQRDDNVKHMAKYRGRDRKSTCLNSSHSQISYAVFCLKKKN